MDQDPPPLRVSCQVGGFPAYGGFSGDSPPTDPVVGSCLSPPGRTLSDITWGAPFAGLGRQGSLTGAGRRAAGLGQNGAMPAQPALGPVHRQRSLKKPSQRKVRLQSASPGRPYSPQASPAGGQRMVPGPSNLKKQRTLSWGSSRQGSLTLEDGRIFLELLRSPDDVVDSSELCEKRKILLGSRQGSICIQMRHVKFELEAEESDMGARQGRSDLSDKRASCLGCRQGSLTVKHSALPRDYSLAFDDQDDGLELCILEF